MRDPYDVLGVQRTADAAAIKSAFRKLAKKHHPDANKSDPKSAQRFAELNTAYEILGDDAKRKAFDRGEIDADGKQRFQGFRAQPCGGPPGGVFGGAPARRSGFDSHVEADEMGAPGGRDVTVPLTISLGEAAR